MTAPKLRFKEFDGDWGKKKFSEQFNFHNTNSYSRALLAEQGEIMNIHYGDIHTKFSMLFDVKEEAVPFLSGEVDTNKIAENQFLQVGDLVIADASEDYKDIGKAIEVINLDNQKVVAGLHTYIARPVERCAIGFNGYLMQTFEVREQIKKLATGISVLGISKTNLGKVELKIPCLAEQTKIASFLSAVDEKISQLSQKLHLLGQYKQGMMQKLFSQQLRFKADDGNEFREWSNKTIGDVANIKRGASPRPINDSKWFDDSSSIGWVRISDVSKSKKYLLQTEQYLSTLGIQKSRLVPKGNLIMSICATIGKPIYTGFDVCIHDGFVVFSELQAIHEYAYYYLEYIEKNWYQYGQAGTQVNLNSDIVSNEAFPFPCLEEQTKIANFLSAIDQKIDVVSEQLEQAKLWKKGLLQQMFV